MVTPDSTLMLPSVPLSVQDLVSSVGCVSEGVRLVPVVFKTKCWGESEEVEDPS